MPDLIESLITQQLERLSPLLRMGEVARRLNEESAGDLASPTVAGAPAGLSRCASQAKPLIDYRKENDNVG